VPLCQFKCGQIHVIFYEDVFIKPSYEISKIFSFIRPNTGSYHINFDSERINQLSRFAGHESNLSKGKTPIISWKNELTSQQIDAGLNILECFGLAELYDDNGAPNRQALCRIHKEA
jgi:hypothetical protein